MKTSLLLKLLQKINTDEFLKKELENLFGKDAIPSMFTSFTDEQFEDLLKSKNTRQILYKIYMYVKGDKLPQDLKKLVDDKIARRGCFIHTACDMLYMFNNEELLKREDIHQIFELIINAPLPKRDYIVNAFKEVDLSKRDNIVEFINIILTAKGEMQAEYASKAYVAIMKEIVSYKNLNGFYGKTQKQFYDENQKNILPLTRMIAECEDVSKSHFVLEFVTASPHSLKIPRRFITESSEKIDICSVLASFPYVTEIAKALIDSYGEEQSNILISRYMYDVYNLFRLETMEEKYNIRREKPVIKPKLLGVICQSKGPIQAEAVDSYLSTIKDYQDEERILKTATTIANWEKPNQIKILCSLFGYDTEMWETYASKITFCENGHKSDTLSEIVTLIKKCSCSNIDVDKIIELISKVEDNSFLLSPLSFLGYLFYTEEFINSKYFCRYLVALSKAKDQLTYRLLLLHMFGALCIEDLDNVSFSIEKPLCYMIHDKNQIEIIINILKETGIGFITNFDDEESVKMVERLVNSQQPIEVTLKELMKLPPDVVEQVLENAPEEIGSDDKVFIIRPQTNKINED